jgi:hypothetical protein
MERADRDPCAATALPWLSNSLMTLDSSDIFKTYDTYDTCNAFDDAGTFSCVSPDARAF